MLTFDTSGPVPEMSIPNEPASLAEIEGSVILPAEGLAAGEAVGEEAEAFAEDVAAEGDAPQPPNAIPAMASNATLRQRPANGCECQLINDVRFPESNV